MIWPNEAEPATSSPMPGTPGSVAIADRLGAAEREIDQHDPAPAWRAHARA